MIKVRAKIVNSRGLHARPAAQLARLAARFDSAIEIRRGRKCADAKSMAALLMLAAAEGAELSIGADGADESEAAAALLELIAAGFRDDHVVNNPKKPEAQPPTKSRRRRHLTHTVSGTGITERVALGRAHIYTSVAADVPRYRIEKSAVAAEVRRYDSAVQAVGSEFEMLREQAEELPGAAEIVPFIDLYKTLLDDVEFVQKPKALIRRRLINAEWALKERVDVINDSFRRIEDSYLRERGKDIENVMRRLLTAMKVRSRQKIAAGTGDNAILVAAELDPADVIHVHQFGYKGFITESGAGTSHAAILARSMNIPALVGARGLMACVREGEQILLDAGAQVAIVNPDATALSNHKKRAREKKPLSRRRRRPGGNGVRCAGGESVFLHTNIELPDEANMAHHAAADGIGLFRTEFLFMHREDLPGEDEQFEIYRHILAAMAPLPVVIRTLDWGGDKISSAAAPTAKSANPALGVRAIRYCLEETDMFLTQLRALLRAGAEHANLRVLLPMLSHPMELEKTVTLLDHAAEQLRATHNINHPLPPLGGMIEVPGAVFIMRALAKRLGFFSIGTNDLIQYTMAIDRNDERLAPLYDPLHPGVLHLLSLIVANANAANRPVVLCGELAGDPTMTRLMLALGLRQLSMGVGSLDAVRERLRGADCRLLANTARHILRAPDPAAARVVLDEINQL